MSQAKKLVAVYPGTFDPLTNGHADIVYRASRLFDHVVVAVADNMNKSSCFSMQERIALAEEVLQDFSNVSVQGFSCLLTDLTNQLNTDVVIRGLRAVSDFEYEFQLAMMNRHVKPNFETIFLTPSEKYMFISSSLVREIAGYRGDITQFVHPQVAQALRQKLRY
jgi:pantetheine-phosphate adenylyltransferase